MSCGGGYIALTYSMIFFLCRQCKKKNVTNNLTEEENLPNHLIEDEKGKIELV